MKREWSTTEMLNGFFVVGKIAWGLSCEELLSVTFSAELLELLDEAELLMEEPDETVDELEVLSSVMGVMASLDPGLGSVAPE